MLMPMWCQPVVWMIFIRTFRSSEKKACKLGPRNFLCRPCHPAVVPDEQFAESAVLADLFLSATVTKELASLKLVQGTIYKALEGVSRTVAEKDFSFRVDTLLIVPVAFL